MSILIEKEFSTEIATITKEIKEFLLNDFNKGSIGIEKDITKFFKKNLPENVIKKLIEKNIKIFLVTKKSRTTMDLNSAAYFHKANDPKVLLKNPFIKITIIYRNLNTGYLQHEVGHVVDQIRQYPKNIIEKDDNYNNLFIEPNSVWTTQLNKYRTGVESETYKTQRDRLIAREKLLGNMFHIYGTNRLEFNQRITALAHKLKEAPYKTKIMNNSRNNYCNYINTYRDLLELLFNYQDSAQMENDDTLKKEIITRLNREQILQFINPEVFNRQIAGKNKKFAAKGQDEKIITASSEIKRMKQLKKDNSSNEELKKRLADYKNKKYEGTNSKFLSTKNEVAERLNASRKLKMERITKANKKNENIKIDDRRRFSIDTDETLEEGIRFFKTSKKLEKLSRAISNKLERLEEPEDRRKVITLLNKLDRLAEKFDKVETLYKIEKIKKEGHPVAEREYNQLTLDFSEIIRLAKRESTKNVLKQIGIYGLLFASMTIPFKLLTEITPFVNSENSKIKNALVYIAMSLPFRLINTDKIVEKTFKGGDMVSAAHTGMIDKNI